MENCLKRTRPQPYGHYDRVGRARFPYSLGLRLHSGPHLGGCRACWTPSGSVSVRSPIVSGLHVLVIRPFVWPAPPALPPSPDANEETDLRWVGLQGCWTWR